MIDAQARAAGIHAQEVRGQQDHRLLAGVRLEIVGILDLHHLADALDGLIPQHETVQKAAREELAVRQNERIALPVAHLRKAQPQIDARNVAPPGTQ